MSSDEVTLTVTIKVSRKAWNAEYGCGEAPQQVRDDFGSWLRTTLEGSPCPPTSIRFAPHTRTRTLPSM
jgi:hypothetical protein